MGIVDETLIPLTEAAKEIPGTPSLNSIFRWASKGARGRVLESVLVGGRRFTSREAIRRFIAPSPSRNPGSGGFSPPSGWNDKRADRELTRRGL